MRKDAGDDAIRKWATRLDDAVGKAPILVMGLWNTTPADSNDEDAVAKLKKKLRQEIAGRREVVIAICPASTEGGLFDPPASEGLLSSLAKGLRGMITGGETARERAKTLRERRRARAELATATAA